MSTASSVLSARVASRLIGASVAAQAGVASGTWASVLIPRVFRGIGAMSHGKNRGRCPLLEYDVVAQQFARTTPGEGGTLTQTVRIRAHVARRDLGAASEQLAAILNAGLAAIRADSDNLTALGDDRIGETQPGPWGLMRDAEMDVEVTFSEDDYEVT